MRQGAFDRNSRVRPDSVEFAVIRLDGRELIGFAARVARPRLRHRGHRLICEYGFFFRSLHNIKVEMNGYNRRAIKLYERIGFRTAGRIRGAIMLNGNRYDQVVMDLLRSELEPKHVVRFRGLERAAGAAPA